MPYIRKIQRDRIDIELFDGLPRLNDSGELNYFLSTIIASYVSDHGLSYQAINDVKGAIQGALAEFDRQVTVPYEEKKIKENGGLAWPS